MGSQRDSDLDVAVLLDPEEFPDRKSRSQFRLTLTSDLIHALLHPHVALDRQQVVENLHDLKAVEELMVLVARYLDD